MRTRQQSADRLAARNRAQAAVNADGVSMADSDDREAMMVRDQVAALMAMPELAGDPVDLIRTLLDDDSLWRNATPSWIGAARALGWNRARLRRAVRTIRTHARDVA